MTITYTKEGMKITHSTGVSQLLTPENLNTLLNEMTKEKERIEKDRAAISAHITKVNSLS